MPVDPRSASALLAVGWLLIGAPAVAAESSPPPRTGEPPGLELLEYLGQLERDGDQWVGPDDLAQPDEQPSPPARTAAPARPASPVSRAGEAARLVNPIGGARRGQ